MSKIYSNVVSLQKTATDDNKFQITTAPLWCREVNIHCTTNGATYGDMTTQEGGLPVGNVLTYQDVNLSDLYFKNASAGSNTVITAIAVLMTDAHKKELGVFE